jgi:hypothetical protein
MSPRRASDVPLPVGIELRHARSCASRRGAACSCEPSYRAWVSPGGAAKIRRNFKTLEAAKLWREDAKVDLRRGVLEAPRPLTIASAAESWLTGARSGTIRNRSGHPYKPSAIRGYEQALHDYVLPAFGRTRLSELTRGQLQRLCPAEDLALGRSPTRPFSASGVVYRAHRLWRAAGLTPISPHECRHTFASYMIAAGVNIKALQVFMGHASITVTLDLYGHLLPGSEDEAAALLSAYLDLNVAEDDDRCGPSAGQTKPSPSGFQRS